MDKIKVIFFSIFFFIIIICLLNRFPLIQFKLFTIIFFLPIIFFIIIFLIILLYIISIISSIKKSTNTVKNIKYKIELNESLDDILLDFNNNKINSNNNHYLLLSISRLLTNKQKVIFLKKIINVDFIFKVLCYLEQNDQIFILRQLNENKRNDIMFRYSIAQRNVIQSKIKEIEIKESLKNDQR